MCVQIKELCKHYKPKLTDKSVSTKAQTCSMKTVQLKKQTKMLEVSVICLVDNSGTHNWINFRTKSKEICLCNFKSTATGVLLNFCQTMRLSDDLLEIGISSIGSS